jgi:choline dehydrogenase-like flavoprotein
MWFMVYASLLVVVSAGAAADPWAVCCSGTETEAAGAGHAVKEGARSAQRRLARDGGIYFAALHREKNPD